MSNPSQTPPVEMLSESDLSRIEQRLMRITGAQIESAHHPVSWQAAMSLCASLRAAWGLIQMAEYTSEEYKRQAEAIIGEVEKERDAQREQLAEAHKNVESLSQTIFRNDAATRMRQACVGLLEDAALQFNAGADSAAIGPIMVCLIEKIESLTLDQVVEKQKENKTMKLTCCFIPEDQRCLIPEIDQPLPDGVGCQELAEWQIWLGPTPDDNTLACTAHVGELLDPEAENRVYRAEQVVEKQ
jgi:hypothetical protein